MDSQDGLSLLVGIWQSGFELFMGCGQSLENECDSREKVGKVLATGQHPH